MPSEDACTVLASGRTPISRSDAWNIGFGLQAVDGLAPSVYAMEQAREQISGEVSYAEVEQRLREYHSRNGSKAEHFEADIVSTRISSILQTESFVFAPSMLARIQEPVLQGRSLPYAPFPLIGEMLDYEFGHEERFQAGYAHTDKHGIAASVFDFVSRLWQIHPFREGNTRTVAVFAILYLERLGFRIGSEPFASHARYFRDALVLDNTLDPSFRNPNPLRRFMEKALYSDSLT